MRYGKISLTECTYDAKKNEQSIISIGKSSTDSDTWGEIKTQ